MQSREPVETICPLWHAMPSSEVLADLDSRETGLTAGVVNARLTEYGPNRLPDAKPRGPLTRFLLQFHNVLIYVLLGAALVTALLQHWVDTAVIVGVVVINAIIGFVQEGKAEDALAAIRQMLSPQTLVVRDGRRQVVAAVDLVPGDILPLQAGDKVAADLRILHARGLHVDEAALTGESVPVEKTHHACPDNAVLADRRSMAYSGTLITAGQGMGVVTATGAETELGHISSLVAKVEQLTTPLLCQMAIFSRWLTLAIVIIASIAFAFGVLVRDYSAADMFLAAVGLAVAAIPEGLPAIMTITLAIGVRRMAASNAIIRRLPAVETLGTLSVICSDKTGTLTCNEMMVRALALPDADLEVSGSGYDPHGGFIAQGRDFAIGSHPGALQMLRAMLLCNDTGVHRTEDGWSIQGDPMEAALCVAGIKAGLDPEQESRRFPRTDLIPFDSAHKFMATLHHSHLGESFVFVKGAPEPLLRRCGGIWSPEGAAPLDIAGWEQRMEQLGAQGYRVIAVAMKQLPQQPGELTFDDIEQDLLLCGLCGLIDPPRPEAIDAVATCQLAGIRVKMITGDHRVTAQAIARQVGLLNTERVLTGQDIGAMTDAELAAQVEDVDVYARVTPEHKLRLVQLLQARGRVVSMTGDGVNDAPALRRADVGVAMGRSGTEVAKESSEMVLTDDHFATIVNAVKEGRTVYDNLRKAILFILPTNGGEGLVVLFAILLGFEQFPLTPVQILWVNMITAATLALALAFEPPEPGIMRRPPRDPREPVLTGLFQWRILLVSLILVAGTFGLFIWDQQRGGDIAHARTVAVNTLVMFEIFYLFNSRFILEPVLSRQGLFGNRYVLVAIGILLVFQLAFTYLPVMQSLFGTAALDLTTWAVISLVASSVLWLVELEKLAVRRIMQRH
ncbi:MAG: cation-transporting P-type ATPase [Chromatiaceae bacterium]|nr:cation-transporting P-type ATPase [Chromatiaceae bacterium]